MQVIPEILSEIETDAKTIFRGHANIDWKLVPSIGRYFTQEWTRVQDQERATLEEFKKRSLPYLELQPNSDIEWLCLMQHHGCPTRLLDFTMNPLIALFFAADPTEDCDGELVVAHYGRSHENVSNKDLFSRTYAFVYHPPHITSRIIGQSGCFVFSPKPNSPVKGKKQMGIRIASKLKVVIRKELSAVGISHSSLFPGVDGICQDLRDTLISDLEIEEIFSY